MKIIINIKNLILQINIFNIENLFINYIKYSVTERGGSVVTNETRIREVPGSNPVAGQRG